MAHQNDKHKEEESLEELEEDLQQEYGEIKGFKTILDGVTQEDAKACLETGYDEAEAILKDPDKTEQFLQKLEEKAKSVKLAGPVLAAVPTMISLIRSSAKREYDAPILTLVAVAAALLYWLLPADLIPDIFPAVGQVDDIAVLAICLNMIDSDLKDYKQWRIDNGLAEPQNEDEESWPSIIEQLFKKMK